MDNKERVLTPHRFTTNKKLTVGQILTTNYLNDQYFNYILDGEYSDAHRGKCGWVGNREVLAILPFMLNSGEVVEVVNIGDTVDGLYIPLIDFK